MIPQIGVPLYLQEPFDVKASHKMRNSSLLTSKKGVLIFRSTSVASESTLLVSPKGLVKEVFFFSKEITN